MNISIWLFGVVTLWALIVTFMLVRGRNGILRDMGHRVFSVTNEKAARVLLGVLEDYTCLRQVFTMDAGPTHQVVMSDGTVIIWHEAGNNLPHNAMSLVVSNPQRDGMEIGLRFFDHGFDFHTHSDIIPETDKFCGVTSTAFESWMLGLRRHVTKMGHPPNRRMLSPLR